MFGRTSTSRTRRGNFKPGGPLAPRRLDVELLEDRRLLAGDLPVIMDASLYSEGEGDGSCSAFARVEQIQINPGAPTTIQITFNGTMEIQSMIDDGSIVSAVQIIDLRSGPLVLDATQFAYDGGSDTLSWTVPAGISSNYHELLLDGAQLRSCGGLQLEGGASGLLFQLPVLASAETVTADSAIIEVENYSVPALHDWNADGLLDLVVGEKTDAEEGKVRVYLNVGSAASPAFSSPSYAQQAGSDLTVPASGCLGVFPTLADWDVDGRDDLIVGLADGSVQVFLNTGSAAEPTFEAPQAVLVGQPAGKTPINVGARATPVALDWNEDGRLDLVVGALDGRLRLFLDHADSGAPDFRTEQFVQDGDGDLQDLDDRSSPAVADFDGDGRKDLVLGNTAGKISFYRNVGTNANPVFDGAVAVSAGGVEIDLDGTPRSRPFVGDFNDDEIPDLLLGAQDGLVRLYTAESWSSPIAHPGEAGAAGETYVYSFSVTTYPWHNSNNPADVTGDGLVTQVDLTQMFDELNTPQHHDETGVIDLPPGVQFYCDVSNDGLFSPRDVLSVIFALTHAGEGEGTGEGEAAPVGAPEVPSAQALLRIRDSNIELAPSMPWYHIAADLLAESRSDPTNWRMSVDAALEDEPVAWESALVV